MSTLQIIYGSQKENSNKAKKYAGAGRHQGAAEEFSYSNPCWLRTSLQICHVLLAKPGPHGLSDYEDNALASQRPLSPVFVEIVNNLFKDAEKANAKKSLLKIKIHITKKTLTNLDPDEKKITGKNLQK